jgi:choline-glycine betaine transporter
MKSIISSAIIYTSHAYQVAVENPVSSSFTIVFAAVLQLVTQSIQIDIFIFLGMIIMIILNTWSGIRMAKKNKTFNLKVLKESIIGKSIGYLMLLTGLAVFCIILFVASLRGDVKLAEDYWFNLPTVLLMVFLSSVEFKSMLDNLEELGVVVPFFVKRLPGKIQDKINDLTDLK